MEKRWPSLGCKSAMQAMSCRPATNPAILVILLVAALLSACSDGSSGAVVVAEVTAEETSVSPPPTLTLASPVDSVQVAQTAAPEFPAFELVQVTPPSTPSIAPKSEQALDAKSLPTGTALATDTVEPSPTPQPTFTPPALPFTSPNEHYWLRRPIAEGGTVWTDKAYPYGSTRGDTLRPHHGVEFYVPSGTEVLAAASGTVVVAGSDREIIYGPHDNFYGNLVIIELDTTFLGQPVYNLYAHLSQILVIEGQHVDAQEVIALSGATGVADGSHLHFEVRVGQNEYGSTRNPLLWLYPFPEHGTLAGRLVHPDGAEVHGQQLFLRRVDAPSKYAETTSYANATGELNADEGWQENFVFDDVVAGYYEVEVRRGSDKFSEQVWIYPYRTSSVEIVLGE
jgi:murein DD-endopeptidase MepM/ murein hydrolase activator NlpD